MIKTFLGGLYEKAELMVVRVEYLCNLAWEFSPCAFFFNICLCIYTHIHKYTCRHLAARKIIGVKLRKVLHSELISSIMISKVCVDLFKLRGKEQHFHAMHLSLEMHS